MCHLYKNYDEDSLALIELIDCGGIGEDAANTKKATTINDVEFSRLRGTHLARDYTREIKAKGKRPDMVFLTSSITSSAHLSKLAEVGRVALQEEALTISILVMPQQDETEQTSGNPTSPDIKRLSKAVDSIVVIPAGRLQQLGGRSLLMNDVHTNNTDLIVAAVRCVSDLMTIPGLICIDFEDVRTVLKKQGTASMGIGISSGDNRAEAAAREAISSPLLEGVCIRNATGVIIQISGGPDMGLHEGATAAEVIEEAVNEDTNIVFGTTVDLDIGEELRVTVLFVGCDVEP